MLIKKILINKKNIMSNDNINSEKRISLQKDFERLHGMLLSVASDIIVLEMRKSKTSRNRVLSMFNNIEFEIKSISKKITDADKITM